MVTFTFAGYTIERASPIVNIADISFNLLQYDKFPNGKAHNEGESARLFLDLLPKEEQTIHDALEEPTVLRGRDGIDLEMATYQQINDFLIANPDLNESATQYCIRIMELKDPTTFANRIVDDSEKEEHRLIRERQNKDLDYLGECGFNDTVHMDKSRNHGKRIINNSNSSQ